MIDVAGDKEKVLQMALASDASMSVPEGEMSVSSSLKEIFDSFGIFDFLLELEETFGVEIDLMDLPEGADITSEAIAGLISKARDGS